MYPHTGATFGVSKNLGSMVGYSDTILLLERGSVEFETALLGLLELLRELELVSRGLGRGVESEVRFHREELENS